MPSAGSDIRLLVPADDVVDPELSIVIPAMNEEISIGRFIEWCHEGLRRADVRGEILIVDSSTDATPTIALAGGARVLTTPRRGLGRAYIDALPYIRGRYVLMGDADCTYDFREIGPFMEKLRGGFEYVMGSRQRGQIEPGSMPALNRYFGKPLTNWLLNFMFGSRFSDIHSGMRAMTRDALLRMDLRSQSWQYASEMIIKALHLGLRVTEVPINFFKEPAGRESHMVREGPLEPWIAGWVSLQAMFVYGADFFLFRPGIVVGSLGLLLLLALANGPVTVGPISFSLYWMLLGLALFIVGVQSAFVGVIARIIFDAGGRVTKRWLGRLPYNRTIGVSALLFVAGCLLTTTLVHDYITQGLSLPSVKPQYHRAVLGLALILFAFIQFTSTLVIHALAQQIRPAKT